MRSTLRHAAHDCKSAAWPRSVDLPAIFRRQAEENVMSKVSRVSPWPTLEAGEIEDRGVFGLQEVVRRSPRNGRVATYQVLRVVPWVNVVALTPDDEVVLVEQYRHGIDAINLEIPGGVLDPGEEPAVTAARELAEETGYTGLAPELLGTLHPNPAIQDNVCTVWLVREARRTVERDLDEGEDIAVSTVPRREIPELIRRGRITHTLVISAFHLLDLHGPDGEPPVGEPML